MPGEVGEAEGGVTAGGVPGAGAGVPGETVLGVRGVLGAGGVKGGDVGVPPGVTGVAPGVLGGAPGVTGVAPGVVGVAPGVTGVVPGVTGVVPGDCAKQTNAERLVHAAKATAFLKVNFLMDKMYFQPVQGKEGEIGIIPHCNLRKAG